MRPFVALALLLPGCKQAPSVQPLSEYVDASACTGCHAEIARQYRETGMGRAFQRPRDIQTHTTSQPHRHAASGRSYTMREEGGRLIQRREGADGVFEKAVDFIIGSGNHARSYLYRGSEGRLYQMPLSWYADRGGYWAMSPGYDRPDHQEFRRAISFDCLGCHAGYPRDAAGRVQQAEWGDDPRFAERIPEGIDCQRCHGPGRAHIEAKGDKTKIVNPKRLSRDRQLDVCMQCHLETTSRPLPYSVPRYDRTVFSYKPGEPLADHIFHFDMPPGTGRDDRFEIAHAAYRLRKSACFMKSGTLTCTTCHDPHRARRGADAAVQFRQACLTCHAQAHRQTEDCGSCHMPKRRTDDVVHVVMTDHFIQRRKPQRDLLAPLSEQVESARTAYQGEVRPYYPSSGVPPLYLAMAQVADGANLKAGIPMLEAALGADAPARAYYQLAEAFWKLGETAKAVPQYEQALRLRPGLLAARRNLGMALRKLGRFEQAAAELEKAGDDAAALTTLGDCYAMLGRTADAERVLRRALAMDPDNPEAHNNLGRLTRSEASLREAIRIRPGFAAAHSNLGNLLAENLSQAELHFRRAIQLDPEYAEGHYNYGTALARAQQWQRAESLLRRAVELDPALADAWNNLGNLYAATGRAPAAVEAFRKAVATRPGFGAAELNLGVALAETGQPAEAREALQRAAGSTDPQVRESALRALLYLR